MEIRQYLDDAIKTGKTVTINYVKYAGEYSVRRISNIQYSEEYGHDYIQAFCHKRQEQRTFKISRIISVDDIAVKPILSPDAVKVQKSAYTGNSSPILQSTSQTSSYSSGVHKLSSDSGSSTKPLCSSSSMSASSSSNTKKSEGCYIATMAYGNYDHPQVIVLRNYRDQVLLKSVAGRSFVKLYYLISPQLVKILSGHDLINFVIRKALDRIVDKISG